MQFKKMINWKKNFYSSNKDKNKKNNNIKTDLNLFFAFLKCQQKESSIYTQSCFIIF